MKEAKSDQETFIQLTPAMMGAFGENIDLGTRCRQIRSTGESHEVSLNYLRTALGNVNISTEESDMSEHINTTNHLTNLDVDFSSGD